MSKQSGVYNALKKWCLLLISLSWLGYSPASTAQAWLDEIITPADARHILTRTGFDAAPESQKAIEGFTRQEVINQVLAGFNTQPQKPMPAWTNEVAPLYWTRRDLDDQSQREFDRLRDQELVSLRTWWIDEMLTTSSPQTERMVLFWHDHFATSYKGVNRQSMAMARQNQTFRELGMGEFETLLRAMIRDPALLNYLNNLTNRKSSPNENLAREFMELFTLGEGNFDEHTVKEAARALTGYGVSQNKNLQPRFNDWQHDWNEKTLFGETGAFNGDDLITILLKQRSLDRHIATRFWHALVADREPTPKELEPLATTFRNSGHRLDALYRAVLESDSFWQEKNRGAMIKSPATLFIGTARALETPKRIKEQIPKLLKLAGQDLFAPPNVSGWQEGPAWITSGRLLNRYTGLNTLLSATQQPNSEQLQAAAENLVTEPTMMSAPTVNMMSGSATTEATGQSMQANTQRIEKPLPLMLKLAAENLNGPPQYRVELLNASDKTVWQSEVYTLKGGWDTARYGPITERYQLPWQTIRLPVPKDFLNRAHIMRVHYLNDAADDSGDRNLYVGALSTDDAFVFAKPGSQVSDCVPDNPADASDLYCQGYVDMALAPLKQVTHGKVSESEKYDEVRYASKHIGWANHNTNNGVLNARIVFQDLRYQGRHWPVFTAWYRVQPDGEPVLWLNSDECWPHCVRRMPVCAWANDRAPNSLTLNFTALGIRKNSDRQCHVSSLQDDEAALVDGLLMNAVTVLSESLTAEENRFPQKRSHIKEALAMMIQRFQQNDIVKAFQESSPTNRTAVAAVPKIVQDDSAKRRYPETQRLDALALNALSLDERQQQIQSQGFTWLTTLAPGIELSTLPGWRRQNSDALHGAKLYQYLQQLLLNPAYHVY